MIRTQIGGKYSARDDSLFTLKGRLQAAGVTISHPLADKIVTTHSGQGYAFDPAKINFYDVEKDYYHCIETSDFHTVNNTFLHAKGYIGDSAALEICIAMLYAKPIVLMYQPLYKKDLDGQLIAIISHNLPKVFVQNLGRTPLKGIREFVQALPKAQHYELTTAQQRFVRAKNDELFKSIAVNIG